MSLMQCPECGAEVSSRAESCPKCGCPLSGDGVRVTIQHTSQNLKILMFGSSVMLVLGIAIVVKGENTRVGQALVVLSLIGWFVARIGLWWKHE